MMKADEGKAGEGGGSWGGGWVYGGKTDKVIQFLEVDTTSDPDIWKAGPCPTLQDSAGGRWKYRCSWYNMKAVSLGWE